MTGVLNRSFQAVVYGKEEMVCAWMKHDVEQALSLDIWNQIKDGREYVIEVFPIKEERGVDCVMKYTQCASVLLNTVYGVRIGECIVLSQGVNAEPGDGAVFYWQDMKFVYRKTNFKGNIIEYWSRVA